MVATSRQFKASERGLALIIAIGFLALLSIVGAVVLNVTSRDLGNTSGFLPEKQAFYTADRAVEYAMNRDLIVNLAPGVAVDLVADNAKDSDGNSMGMTHKSIIETGAGETLVAGTVQDLGPREMPPALATLHGSDFGANLYHVAVDATAPGNQESRVNASIVRLFKLDDDTIFRTSGGG